MTPLAWLCLGAAGAAALADWLALAAGSVRGERMAKPLVVVALLGMALAATGTDPGVRPWLLAALVGSLAGDILLLPPGRFVAGLVAFLLAQLAYLAAFAGLPGTVEGTVLGAVLGVALVVFVGRSIVRGAANSGLAPAVSVYLAAICAMAVAATRTGVPMAAVGAWLFVASDAILGWDRFAAAAPGSPRVAITRRLGVIVPYHVGQALLVLALIG